VSDERRIDRDGVLQALLQGTVAETGTAFLRALVSQVCRVVDAHGCWVTEWLPETRRLRALAFWLGDRWVDEYEYAVDGTPCQPVIDHCRPAHFRRGVIDMFPGDPDLPGMGAVSYRGVPLLGGDGDILGHLAVLDTKPMTADPLLETVFDVFAARAAAEIRRLRAEQALAEREEQLARLFDTAMDAVLVFDERRRIVRANPAANRVLGLERGQLVSRAIGGFLDRDTQRAVEERIAAFRALHDGERRHWFADGLVGRRADGASFPAEGTLSCFETRRGRFYTLILRDVNDRVAAERRLRVLTDEADYLREQARAGGPGGDIIGRTPAMRRLFRDIERVAGTDATVLVRGETGTGKELVARAIHRASRRADGPLIRVNCAAIPATLVESELFGHEKGAFTGATHRRDGRFALADGGTLFLDEIGELALELQAKLLRVLQEGEFEPLGSARTVRVDVRLIAATHRDPAQMLAAGEFREDLFYRLDVFPLHVPALRERSDDVQLLAEAFVAQFAARMGRQVAPLRPADVARLRAYPWPGNVRELQNVIERALILSPGPEIDIAAAMPEARGVAPAPPPAAPADGADGADGRILSAEEMRALERENLRRALEAAGWKVSGEGGAAQRLGLPASTVASRMKALGLQRANRWPGPRKNA
jgi:PAS domain S-box-containing protein